MPQIIKDVNEVSRKEWLEMRRQGIGGSDAAAILGVSKWSDAAKVYAEKKGIVELDEKPNDDMIWGSKWERLILEHFQEQHPDLLVVPGGFWRSDSHEFMQASPDGLCFKGTELVAILEVKKPGDHMRPYWGIPGTDDIPKEYHIQGDHNMFVVGVKKCIYPVLIGKSDYREYEVFFDGDLASAIVFGEGKFWSECVEAGEMPKITGSKASTELLQKLYPKDERPIVTIKGGPNEAIMREVMAIDAERKAIDERWKEIKNRAVHNLIKDAAGVDFPGIGRITFKKSKDGEKVDHAKILAEIKEHVPAEILQKAFAAHTSIKQGSRRFLTKWEESE